MLKWAKMIPCQDGDPQKPHLSGGTHLSSPHMRVPALNMILSFFPCQCTVVGMELVGTPMFIFMFQ